MVGKKVAFIGDSFSAYYQDGQKQNNWTYLLSQKFPQHQYFNYAKGGRGYDYYQWCILDACVRGIDIIFVNRTFPNRVAELATTGEFTFSRKKVTQNYHVMEAPKHIWWSRSRQSGIYEDAQDTDKQEQSSINQSLVRKYVSSLNTEYNSVWYNNVSNLYNFKKIFMLELIFQPSGPVSSEQLMYLDLMGVDHATGQKAFDAGITVSPSDGHLSLKGNTWCLNNYVLTKEVIDILS